jgi:hypothetical protein
VYNGKKKKPKDLLGENIEESLATDFLVINNTTASNPGRLIKFLLHGYYS